MRNKQNIVILYESLEIIKPYNSRKYMVDQSNRLYFLRYKRKGVTTWQCCSSQFCPGRLLATFEETCRISTNHQVSCQPNIVKLQQIKFKSAVHELCQDKTTQRSYVDIYNIAAELYPMGAKFVSKKNIMNSMIRWRYRFTDNLPTTLDELDHIMQDPQVYAEYGRSTFGNFLFDEKEYRLYDKLVKVQICDAEGQMINSKIMCFVNWTVINHIKGTRIHLAGDGTENLQPKNAISYAYKFDSLKQLYVVHLIWYKKFYPIGMFLIQHTKAVVMKKLFEICADWLSAETIVESVMLDFEKSTRKSVTEVWPNAKVLPCAFHYQKRIGYFAIEYGIFTQENNSSALQLLDMALGLCFLPEDMIEEAVDCMSAMTTPDCKDFSDGLIGYIRKEWLPKAISVANLEIRVNNGSEIFFSSAKRNSKPMQSNPLQYLKFLQSINHKVATELTQWNCFRQSKKQRELELLIAENLKTLRSEYDHLGASTAICNFLHTTKLLTKHVHKFFCSVDRSDAVQNLDVSELLVPDLNSNRKNQDKMESMKILLTPMSDEQFFAPKTVIVTNAAPSRIGKAANGQVEMPSNLYFQCATVSNDHAEIMLLNGSIYIKDLGSENGTFINGIRFGRSGVPWTPQLLQDNCHLQFGSVTMKFSLSTKAQPSSLSTYKVVPTKSVTLSLQNCLHDESIPCRILTLSENEKTIIGRATVQDIPASTNASIKTVGVSRKQAEIWTANGKVFLKAMRTSFPVTLNGVRMRTFQEIRNGSSVTLGKQGHIVITISFPENVDNQTPPMITLLPYGELGSTFSIKKLFFDETLTITIGRAAEQHETQSSNGLFSSDVKALSKIHARFQYLNGVVHLVDLNSSSGTFCCKDTAITMRCSPNVPVEITEGDIVQFGSSTDAKKFVKAIVRITADLDHDATELTRENFNDNDVQTVLFRHEPTADTDAMTILQLMSIPNCGAPFTPKTIRFQSDSSVPIGRETADRQATPSNGIFTSDKTSVSRLHARFEVVNKTVYLVDLKSSAGTFHRSKDGPILKCVPNVPVRISSGDTVRFGASSDTQKFVSALIIIGKEGDRITNRQSTIPTDDYQNNCDDRSIMQRIKKNVKISKRPALPKLSRCSPKRHRHFY